MLQGVLVEHAGEEVEVEVTAKVHVEVHHLKRWSCLQKVAKQHDNLSMLQISVDIGQNPLFTNLVPI